MRKPQSVAALETLGRVEAAYEATLLASIINAARPCGSRDVYLTLLGGGAFGNQCEWILDSLRRGLDTVRGHALNVCLVSHGQVPEDLLLLANDATSRP